jgi:hypothetical protein
MNYSKYIDVDPRTWPWPLVQAESTIRVISSATASITVEEFRQQLEEQEDALY